MAAGKRRRARGVTSPKMSTRSAGAIVMALSSVVPRETAYTLGGVSRRTGYYWQARGQRAKERARRDPDYPIFLDGIRAWVDYWEVRDHINEHEQDPVIRKEKLAAVPVPQDYEAHSTAAYAAFYDATMLAIAQRKRRLVTRIEGHGTDVWQPLAWLLERMHPTEYGRKRVEVIKPLEPTGPGADRLPGAGDVPPAMFEVVIVMPDNGRVKDGEQPHPLFRPGEFLKRLETGGETKPKRRGPKAQDLPDDDDVPDEEWLGGEQVDDDDDDDEGGT